MSEGNKQAIRFDGDTLVVAQPEASQKKEKLTVVIASTEGALEDQARDEGEEKMTEDAANQKGVVGFFIKMWKHNLFHEYTRQVKIANAKQRLLALHQKDPDNDNDKAERKAHEEAMAAVVERFTKAYELEAEEGVEALIHKDAKEESKKDTETAEEANVTKRVKALIKEFVLSQSQETKMTEEQFKEKSKTIISSATGLTEEQVAQAVHHTDNLFKIAEQVKSKINHDNSIDDIIKEVEVVIGKARVGVRTQAHKTHFDNVNKYLLGRLCANELVAAATFSLGMFALQKGLGIGATALTLGGSAAVVGGVAAWREDDLVEKERAQHAREMAKGKTIDQDNKKRREEMEESRLETLSATKILNTLNKYINSTTEPSTEDNKVMLKNLAILETRIKFSDSKNIDLIAYSSPDLIEQERLAIDVVRAKVKVKLKSSLEGSFDSKFSALKNDLETIYNENITQKDKLFRAMKHERVATKAVVGFATAAVLGVVAKEAAGLFGDWWTGGEAHAATVDAVNHGATTVAPNVEPLQVHTDTLNAVEYVQGHKGTGATDFHAIHRGTWFDNDTDRPDLNEVKVRITNADANGHYAVSVKGMTPGGSFNHGHSVDPTANQYQNLRMLLSLTKGTQNFAVEVPIDANGQAVIDPNSEIGKMFFEVKDGHLKFIGKFMEIGQVVGDASEEKFNILATAVGHGNNSISHEVAESVATGVLPAEHIEAATTVVGPIIKAENVSDKVSDGTPFVTAIPLPWRKSMEKMNNPEAAAPTSNAESNPEEQAVTINGQKKKFEIIEVRGTSASTQETTKPKKFEIKKKFEITGFGEKNLNVEWFQQHNTDDCGPCLILNSLNLLGITHPAKNIAEVRAEAVKRRPYDRQGRSLSQNGWFNQVDVSNYLENYGLQTHECTAFDENTAFVRRQIYDDIATNGEPDFIFSTYGSHFTGVLPVPERKGFYYFIDSFKNEPVIYSETQKKAFIERIATTSAGQATSIGLVRRNKQPAAQANVVKPAVQPQAATAETPPNIATPENRGPKETLRSLVGQITNETAKENIMVEVSLTESPILKDEEKSKRLSLLGRLVQAELAAQGNDTKDDPIEDLLGDLFKPPFREAGPKNDRRIHFKELTPLLEEYIQIRGLNRTDGTRVTRIEGLRGRLEREILKRRFAVFGETLKTKISNTDALIKEWIKIKYPRPEDTDSSLKDKLKSQFVLYLQDFNTEKTDRDNPTEENIKKIRTLSDQLENLSREIRFETDKLQSLSDIEKYLEQTKYDTILTAQLNAIKAQLGAIDYEKYGYNTSGAQTLFGDLQGQIRTIGERIGRGQNASKVAQPEGTQAQAEKTQELPPFDEVLAFLKPTDEERTNLTPDQNFILLNLNAAIFADKIKSQTLPNDQYLNTVFINELIQIFKRYKIQLVESIQSFIVAANKIKANSPTLLEAQLAQRTQPSPDILNAIKKALKIPDDDMSRDGRRLSFLGFLLTLKPPAKP